MDVTMRCRACFIPIARFLVSLSFNAWAQGYVVRNYDVDIQIHKNGYFDVVEQYDVEFFEPRRGIIRDIITKYDFADAEGQSSKRVIKISKVRSEERRVGKG